MKDRPQARRDGETSSAKPKVFVSYAREDSEFVDRLVRDLERDGFEPWIDRGRMRGGDAFPEEIARAIRDVDFFLIVVSPSSNKSRWVQDELNQAVARQNNSGRPQVIPIRLGKAPLPVGLVGKHSIQFGRGSYEGGYAELRGALLGQPAPAVRKSRRSWWVAAAVALPLLGVGIGQILKSEDLPTIAVASFINDSRRAEDDWISTALGDMLTVALQGGGAHVVDREEVVEAERDFAFATTPADFHRRLGANIVVQGSFDPPGSGSSDLTVSWHLPGRACPGGSTPKIGSLDGLVDLASEISNEVRSCLGLSVDATRQQADLRALFPRSRNGQKLYFSGVVRLRHFDTAKAYDLFGDASRAEPEQFLIYRRLASVAPTKEVSSLTAKAYRLSRSLPSEGVYLRERLEIELMNTEMENPGSPKVFDLYSQFLRVFQHDFSFFLKKAEAEQINGHSYTALATLRALIERRPPLYIKAQAKAMQADIQEDLGYFETAKNLADEAVQSAEKAGSVYWKARAQLIRGRIHFDLGHYDWAENDLKAACDVFSQWGDIKSLHPCKLQRAEGQLYLGRPIPEILSDLQALERVYRSSDYKEALAEVLDLESAFLSELGDLKEADSKLEEASLIQPQKNQYFLVALLTERARSLFLSGATEQAEALLDRAVAVPVAGTSADKATALSTRAEIFYYRGDLERALAKQTTAFQAHDGSLKEYDRFRLGMTQAAQGVAEGRRNVEAAYEQQGRLADYADQAETALGLARLDTLAGDFDRAAEKAEEAKRMLKQAGRPDLVALAQAARGWALACGGQREEAEKALAAAEQRSRSSKDFRVHFETAIAAARLKAFTHPDGSDAFHNLEMIGEEARARGFLTYELDARLALGEVKLALGKGGISELKCLAKDADELKFLQLSRLAKREMQEGPVCSGRPLSFWRRLFRWLR